MTNRDSRVIGSAHELIKDLDAAGEEPRRKLLVEHMYRRARDLRLAIISSAASILFVAVTVLSLFTGQVIGAHVDYLSVSCFGVSLLALVGSLYFFIRDVTISLMAPELEIAPHKADSFACRNLAEISSRFANSGHVSILRTGLMIIRSGKCHSRR